MVNGNTLSEIGDVLNIYSQVVVNASIDLSGFTDETFGENQNRFFTKKFRYSLDGLNFSEWLELTNENIQAISGTVNGLLFFEFKYERSGTETSGILEFISIEIFGNIDIQIVENTATLDSIFAELANNDFHTEAIRNNIMRKIYHNGIIPKFIERGEGIDDEDFISYWSAVCLFFAYFSSFADNFDNLLYNRDYLAEYLKQSNVQVNDKELVYEDLFYIVQNLYDQMRKRGTAMTFKKKGEELKDGFINEVDGEWLRLVCKRHYDEFLLEVIPKENSGFCLGSSSPMYNGTYFSKQLNKTEENTSDFVDLSKYSVMGEVSIAENVDGLNCLNIRRHNSGLGFDFNSPPFELESKELITIDENIDYEFTFNFKRITNNPNFSNCKLRIGILCYNRNNILIPNATENIFTESIQNLMLDDNLFGISKIRNEWYSFRGVLYSKFSEKIALLKNSRTNLNKGSNLRIASSNSQIVDKIKLCVYITNEFYPTITENIVFIHDLKFRPLIRGKNILNRRVSSVNAIINEPPYILNPQFLQSTTFCLNWRVNNNQDKNDLKLDNFIQNYLIPYQHKIVGIPLKSEFHR